LRLRLHLLYIFKVSPRPRPPQIIAHHLILSLYGHWAVNDPRGSGSSDFKDLKFAPLGPIHHGRKPEHLQPSRTELRSFHHEHQALVNFPIFWMDEAKRQAWSEAISDVIARERYTCYACAICSNHAHLVIRIHRDDALTIWNNLAEESRVRLRLGFPEEIAPNHPVISDRPYKVFLYTPEDVRNRIDYIERNPVKEGLPPQTWPFVTPYNNWPLHKQTR
jgi:REP element-mobilizing transposase RayT